MRKTSYATLCAVATFLVGCVISQGTINSYIDPTYEPGEVKRIAVFSIRNARFSPAEARQINRDIIQALIAKNPNIEIVSPSESLRKINEGKLAEKWSDFVEDYYTSGIANQEILSLISEALGVDAIMQGNLLNVSQVDGNNWDRLGRTRITISFSVVETKSAKIIWEASADGIKENASGAISPPIADALDLAIDKVVENVPML